MCLNAFGGLFTYRSKILLFLWILESFLDGIGNMGRRRGDSIVKCLRLKLLVFMYEYMYYGSVMCTCTLYKDLYLYIRKS